MLCKGPKQGKKLLWIPEERSINNNYWNHSEHVWLQLCGLHNMFVKIFRQLRNLFQRIWDIMKFWKKFWKPFEKLFWVSCDWKTPQTVNILCEISLVNYFLHVLHSTWYLMRFVSSFKDLIYHVYSKENHWTKWQKPNYSRCL